MPGRPSPAQWALAALACVLSGCAHTPVQALPVQAAPAPAEKSRGACREYGPEPAVSLTPDESRVLGVVAERLAPAGAPPRVSGALVAAARELALGAARGDPAPLGRSRLRGALARACAADPSPAAVLVEAPLEQLAAAASDALPRERATDLGAGIAVREGVAVLVLLASERTVRLAPFPRDVVPGARAVLAGRLAPGRGRPRVFVTDPGGTVREAETTGGREFRAEVLFSLPGRHAVGLVAEAEGGPEVAALLTVSVGGAALDAPARARSPAPADDDAAEAAVVRAMNATRLRHGIAPLGRAPELDEVARRHSAAMAAAAKVAHVLPGTGDLGARLRRARVPYRRVYENVARAATALDAHEAAEESPAHLANILRRDATRVGVGLARGRLPSGAEQLYLTEVFVEPPDDGAESPLTPEARVREALWRERARGALPPLTADPALDALARDQALALRARDASAPAPDAGERALALGAGRRLAAVDVFVASGPEEATRSSNLTDARLRRVGVGVATGDSPRFGAGRFWIVVVYTD
jgi:uncharacterized protein YkwD